MTLKPAAAHLHALIAARGFVPVYRPDETNRCPGCSASSWLIGRQSAQCAVCAAAIPFAVPPIHSTKG